MSDASRLKSTVFVGGLDHAVTKDVLFQAFIPFGEIVEVTLPKPDLSSKGDPHRGFGYVEFQEVEDAREAMDNMDQSELYGRVIRVNAAKAQKEHNEGLGSKTAVWEQEEWISKYGGVEQSDQKENDGEAKSEDDQRDPMHDLEGLDVAGPKLA